MRASLSYRVRSCFKKKEMREGEKVVGDREGVEEGRREGWNTTETKSEKYRMRNVNSLHRGVSRY